MVPFLKRIEIRSADKFIKEVEETIYQYENRKKTTSRCDGMRSPFEEHQRERDEHIRKETIELVVKVADMLDENLPLERISKQTGFSIEQIKMIQRLK